LIACNARVLDRFNVSTLQRFHSRSVVAYRFDRAAFHRLFAKSFFFRRLRLFIDVGMAAVVVPFEIGGRGFTAQIAIDALIIDVELAWYVFGVFVRDISHGCFPKGERER
jgi:hypothetical protein